MILSRTFIWRKLREHKILAQHKRIAGICEKLISEYRKNPTAFAIRAKKEIGTEKIVWQYWGQGYDDVPTAVKECLDSVDKWMDGYLIIRLSDRNIHEYLDIPNFVKEKRNLFSFAHFADLLRLMLLQTYGGIWMDATILLLDSIPVDYTNCDFFVFRRDPNEPNYRYWRNTYAYYFGWAKGFRVNMLNSFIVAKKGNRTISELCDLLLLWWQKHDEVPDYFFFQILYDTYNCQELFPLVSDTLPHYKQQSVNDPKFMSIFPNGSASFSPIQKMTYKD